MGSLYKGSSNTQQRKKESEFTSGVEREREKSRNGQAIRTKRLQ
jgi:hypothetical protein